jgi:hypothetical protein
MYISQWGGYPFGGFGRPYMAAGIGYPYYGGLGFAGYGGWGYPGWGGGFPGYPYL